MTRIQVLQQVDELTNKHCFNCRYFGKAGSSEQKYCTTKCKVGQELQAIGNQLLKPRRDKVKSILAKRKDMTTRDIVHLLNSQVAKVEIAKHLGVKKSEGIKIVNEIERAEKMKTNKAIVEELVNEGLTEQEIFEKTKIPL